MAPHLTTLALALGSLLCVPTALAQSTTADDAEALRRMELYRVDLIATLPDADKLIAQRVALHAPAGGFLAAVGAGLATDGIPVISINVGSHYAMQQLGEAMLLAVHVLKSDNFLLGYIRYLAYWDQFGARPKTAVQFAQHYGVADPQARLDALSDVQRSTGQGAEAMMMLFIMAHELAHHIHGDVNQGLLPAAAQRQQEARADAWAAQRVMTLGYSPEMAVMSMLVINQIERASPGNNDLRRHPEALRRAQDLMLILLDNLTANPQFIRAELARNPGSLSFDAYAQALRKMDQLLHAQADEQQLLDTDAKSLQDSAKKGNIRSQLRLAELHQTGDMDGLPRSNKAARFWSEVAALNDTRYEYFDSAYAAYFAGKMVAKDGGNNTRACYYMDRAASMGLTLGILSMEQLKKDGICRG